MVDQMHTGISNYTQDPCTLPCMMLACNWAARKIEMWGSAHLQDAIPGTAIQSQQEVHLQPHLNDSLSSWRLMMCWKPHSSMQKRHGVANRQTFVPSLRRCSAYVSENPYTCVWAACYQYLIYSILSDQCVDLALTRTLPASGTKIIAWLCRKSLSESWGLLRCSLPHCGQTCSNKLDLSVFCLGVMAAFLRPCCGSECALCGRGSSSSASPSMSLVVSACIVQVQDRPKSSVYTSRYERFRLLPALSL